DQRPGIDFAGFEERQGLVKWAAAGANHGEFLHNDRPGFNAGGSVECRFQNERVAWFGHVLGERQASGRTGGLNKQVVGLLDLFQVGGIAAHFLGFDFGATRKQEFAVVLSIHNDARNSGSEDAGEKGGG